MKQSPLNMRQESGAGIVVNRYIEERDWNCFLMIEGIWNASQDLYYPDDDRFPEAVAGLQFMFHVEARTPNNALKLQVDVVKDTL